VIERLSPWLNPSNGTGPRDGPADRVGLHVIQLLTAVLHDHLSATAAELLPVESDLYFSRITTNVTNERTNRLTNMQTNTPDHNTSWRGGSNNVIINKAHGLNPRRRCPVAKSPPLKSLPRRLFTGKNPPWGDFFPCKKSPLPADFYR